MDDKFAFLCLYRIAVRSTLIFVTVLSLNLDVCLLSMDNAFLPSSKAKPNVNANKKIKTIAKPYASFVYALTRYG